MFCYSINASNTAFTLQHAVIQTINKDAKSLRFFHALLLITPTDESRALKNVKFSRLMLIDTYRHIPIKKNEQ